ncbi:NADPH-dependent FMN reductase [Paenibacillus sp.]|uniref:NADPH-dependent FMN reductase n=1 Tax=Paenibacillus sp. TaxID=58172 RepID=UPI002810A7C7|nr:NADPH-dependent FMN reductase [Paenibacillus sp.]
MTNMNMVLLAGSNRKDASSTKLLRYMKERLKARGVEATLFDVYESPLPIFSPDDAEAHPNARRLVAAVQGADGLVLGTPEYHGSISGALKNALDYLGSGEVGGKPVLSVSSSGGAVGVSSLTHLQGIVRGLHGINSPEWVSIGGRQWFNADGSPADEGMRTRVERALDQLVAMTEALRGVTAR